MGLESRSIAIAAFALISLGGCGKGLYPLGGSSPSGAHLSVSDGGLYAYGTLTSGQSLDKIFSLTNSGDAPSGSLTGSTLRLVSPFSFKGGSFPGTGGTCGTQISPGVTCDFVVTFFPVISGIHSGSVSLQEDGVTAASVSVSGRALGGSLDTTFGSGGIALIASGPGASGVGDLGVRVQADGKVLVASSIDTGAGSEEFATLRFLTNGTLDSTWDGDGIAITDISIFGDEAHDVAVQPDGKVISVGHRGSSFIAIRYLTNGTLDSTFDGDGIVEIFSNGESARAVEMLSDGSIVAGGWSGNGIAAIKLLSNGQLDSTFGVGGIAAVTTGASNNARVMEVQPDGKIVLAGQANLATVDFLVVRFHSNGTIDSSFSGDGVLTLSFGTAGDMARSLSLQTDGRILVGGAFQNGGVTDSVMVRLLSDGSLDTTFDLDGILTTAVSTGADGVHGLARKDDGNILFGGSQGGDIYFGQLRSDGSFDSDFGTNGLLLVAPTTASEGISAMRFQSDGRAVVAGLSGNGFPQTYLVLRLYP